MRLVLGSKAVIATFQRLQCRCRSGRYIVPRRAL